LAIKSRPPKESFQFQCK